MLLERLSGDQNHVESIRRWSRRSHRFHIHSMNILERGDTEESLQSLCSLLQIVSLIHMLAIDDNWLLSWLSVSLPWQRPLNPLSMHGTLFLPVMFTSFYLDGGVQYRWRGSTPDLIGQCLDQNSSAHSTATQTRCFPDFVQLWLRTTSVLFISGQSDFLSRLAFDSMEFSEYNHCSTHFSGWVTLLCHKLIKDPSMIFSSCTLTRCQLHLSLSVFMRQRW